MFRFGAVAFVLLALLFQPQARNSPATVHLTVKHNGRIVEAPGWIDLHFQGQSVKLPLQDGRFQVPPEAQQASAVTLTTAVRGEQIRFHSFNGAKFKASDWTLILEDRRYGDEFQWAVPKGARVSSSCIMLFESELFESTFTFSPNCRSKAHGPGK